MKSETVHIGVDVSKEKLDVFNPQTGRTESVPNTAEGFGRIREMARELKAVVCCEPTGGFETDMILHLQQCGVDVAYCEGYKVRHFALSRGQFAKNDRIDAQMISLFADHAELRILDAKDRALLRLRSRWGLYKAFLSASTLFAQKASTEHDKPIRRMLESESKRLKEKANRILKSCVEIATRDERMGYLLGRFTAIDGVADRTAIAVIAGLPEIGKLSDAKLAKLVGVAPLDNQSGKTDKEKRIFGGRSDVRASLYMAVVPSIRSNHILGPYYEQVARRIPGPRAKKWAMVPVMRKLLSLMNRLASDPDFELQRKPAVKAA